MSEFNEEGWPKVRPQDELWDRIRALEARVERLERHLTLDYAPQFDEGDEDDRRFALIGDDGKVVGYTEASPTGGDQQPEQWQDSLRRSWGREITYGSGVLPDEGGTG